MSHRLGLFGGSFNPIHFGHLIVARALLEKLSLDQVYLLPSRNPPHKDIKSLADAGHRANMVRMAIEGEAGLRFDDFDLTRPGPCFTIDTVAHFRERFSAAELFWFIGADSLMELPTWHRAKDLISSCNVVTAARSGKMVFNPSTLEQAFGKEETARLLGGVVETPFIDISSTDIRNRVAQGLSIRYLLPGSVRIYIEEHQLYRT